MQPCGLSNLSWDERQKCLIFPWGAFVAEVYEAGLFLPRKSARKRQSWPVTADLR